MPSIERRVVDIAAKRGEIQNEIEQSYADLEQHELNNHEYEFVQRNILLVGHSKSGKTTLGHVLADPRNPAEELTLRAAFQTEARCETNIHLPSSKIVLNIVELPETMINSVPSLHEINAECHRLQIQDFHLICFCVSFDTGINGQVLQSFERFINYFGQEKVRQNLCLIITRCEAKDEDQRERLRNELREDMDYKRISQDFCRGIHFFGAINRDDWNRANESLLDQFETVYYCRKNLLDIIRTDVQPFHIPEQQQQEQSSISRNTSEDSSQSTLAPVIQSVTLPRMETFDQPNMLDPRLLEPPPTVRSDLHPVAQPYELPRSPSELNEETALLNKRSRWKFRNCCYTICAYVVLSHIVIPTDWHLIASSLGE